MGQTCECTGEPQDAENAELLMGGRADGDESENGDINIEDYSLDVSEEDVKVEEDVPIEIPPDVKDPPESGEEEFKQPEYKDGEDSGPFDMLPEISTSPTIQAKGYVAKDVKSINSLIKKMRQPEIKKGLVSLLCSRTMSHRLRIRESYQQNFSSDLAEEITVLKKGKTRTLLMQLLQTPADLMATQILQAIKDLSTRDVALIIVVLTNRQIVDLREAFPRQDPEQRDIKDVVINFCKDDHMKLLLTNLLECEESRLEEALDEVDETKAMDDAEKIKTALEVARPAEIDVQAIVEILSTRSWHHIAKIAEKYTAVSDFRALLEAMEKKGFKNIDVGTACHTLVQIATDRYGYFAGQLSGTESSWGRMDHDTVALIIMYRCEIDLGEIIQTFSDSEGYGSNMSFQMWLERKITGTFGYALSLLCGLAVTDGLDDEPEPGAAVTPAGPDDPGRIPRMNEICSYSDFASFCGKKIGEKARQSLWRKVDRNEDGVVDATEVRDLLIYTAVVYYTHKLKKEHGVKNLDDNMRKEAPDFVEPITQWILSNKLSDGSVELARENFVENEVQWIQEYANFAEQP